MNNPYGYRQVTIPSTGEVIEFKFGNGASEIFGGLMGLTTFEEIDKALGVDIGKNPDEEGFDEALSRALTTDYLKAIRLWIYSAAKYAALAQGKPIKFNEWSPVDWINEVGINAFVGKITEPEPSQPSAIIQ